MASPISYASGIRVADFHCINVEDTGLMLYYALVFLLISLIAGVLGFGGIAGTAAQFSRILFVVFLVLFVVSLVAGRVII